MTLRSVRLPKSQRLAARRSEVKSLFQDVESLSVWLGGLTKEFKFDSRCFQRPKLGGPVVASLSVSRDLAGILQLYPVDRLRFPDAAAFAFEVEILPRMRKWLGDKQAKPETAILGCEELIVEWNREKFATHEVRFL